MKYECTLSLGCLLPFYTGKIEIVEGDEIEQLYNTEMEIEKIKRHSVIGGLYTGWNVPIDTHDEQRMLGYKKTTLIFLALSL